MSLTVLQSATAIPNTKVVTYNLDKYAIICYTTLKTKSMKVSNYCTMMISVSTFGVDFHTTLLCYTSIAMRLGYGNLVL